MHVMSPDAIVLGTVHRGEDDIGLHAGSPEQGRLRHDVWMWRGGAGLHAVSSEPTPSAQRVEVAIAYTLSLMPLASM